MQRGDLVTVSLQGDYGKPRPALVVQSNFIGGPGQRRGLSGNQRVAHCRIQGNGGADICQWSSIAFSSDGRQAFHADPYQSQSTFRTIG